MGERYEGGSAPQRTEWVAETTEGQTPADPSWNLYSDNLTTLWDWEPDANTASLEATGTVKPQGFFNGSEVHEATFSWWQQQWFVDGSGNTVDPAYDGMDVASDNSIKTTHTVVTREVHNDGGTAGAGRRIYIVGKGGHPQAPTIPFETEEGLPIELEMAYQFEKIRTYSISQPDSGTTLDITNNGSSSVDVTIEDEGAGTSETVTVSSGATSSTTSSFADIDAVELSTDVDGDVTVDDGSGNTLVTIKGKNNYPADEGDLGVPALGSGSHASALGSSYVIFNNDTLQYSSGAISDQVASAEAEVGVELDSDSETGTQRQDVYVPGDGWGATVTATVAAPNVADAQVTDYLTEVVRDVVWTADEGTLTFKNGQIQSPGTITKESDQGKLMVDVEFGFEDITVST
jgi:hypothetical protein